MREIDKIMQKYANMTLDDKKIVDASIEIISGIFKAMIQGSTEFIKNGKHEQIDMSNAIEALKKLRDVVGEEIIPEIENEQEARIYITKFGKEILLS